ncbi:PRELI domain containing 1b isoform X1 [Pleuronectes platessa]|uniref:PRELI domain containing 1b isoform X1 n=1 Tax=Pleuronectes platessa TaxID=8262 RepID=UPI00232A612D|nr:PRELI domain containing 1b isoform X1 [Pleuronectes platessa]
MVKYFCNSTDISSTWDQVFSAFWQRYPNPYSNHVLTEDVVYREVTADQQLLSRRLLTKTNRLPRWAERFFPSGMSRCVYIIEDSIVDPVNRSLTIYTWNLNHTTLMSVEERCIFRDSAEQPSTTLLKREAWISSGIYGFSRPIQEFGLARFKSNQVKAMKGLEYALSNLQAFCPTAPLLMALQGLASECCGEAHPRLLRDTMKDASGKAKEAAKNLASAAAATPQKPQQFI